MNQEQVWDNIAEDWYHFRQQKFPELYWFLEKYCNHLVKGKVLEVGCGNGRNLIPFFGFEKYGCDFSAKVLELAKKFAFVHNMDVNLKKCDMRQLSYQDEMFDIVLNVAALHHLEDGREDALREMFRVMKPNGVGFITVWHELKEKDGYVSWGKKGDRYYHKFGYFELKKLIVNAGFKILKSSGFFGKNLVFVIEK